METIALAWISDAPGGSALMRTKTKAREDLRQSKEFKAISSTDAPDKSTEDKSNLQYPMGHLEYYTFAKIGDWSTASRHKIDAPMSEMLEKMKTEKGPHASSACGPWPVSSIADDILRPYALPFRSSLEVFPGFG